MDIPAEMLSTLLNNRDQILAIEGVLGIDIGFTEPNGTPSTDIAICVLVADLSNVPAGIPETLGGFPVAVIKRSVQLFTDHTRYDPVQGGVSVSRGIDAGTLGAVVRDAQGGTIGRLLGLSCRHVFCGTQLNPSIADVVLQPEGISSSDRLGAIARFSPIGPAVSPQPPNLPIGLSDAAICTIERTATATIVDIGAVNGTATAMLEDLVRKRGKESSPELTHGTVTHLFRAILVPANSQTDIWWLYDQFEILSTDPAVPFSVKGDSGSVILKEDTNEIVGLLWGGGDAGDPPVKVSYASNIDNVVTDLSISLFWPIPQISTINPSQGQSGDEVVITGIGFQLASEVTFGGISSQVFNRQVDSDTEIIATVPSGFGKVDVLVTAPGGTSLGAQFIIIPIL
jgi:hypothetical protein